MALRLFLVKTTEPLAMRAFRASVVLLISCFLPPAATSSPIASGAAATAANQFAEAAFVSRDFPKAHTLLAPEAQQQVPVDKLTQVITEMHPETFPSRVRPRNTSRCRDTNPCSSTCKVAAAAKESTTAWSWRATPRRDTG